MVSARGALRTEGFRYALDNGAWTSFQRGEPFDEAAFERAVARLGADARGRVGIEWGVYGVPETYFVDRQGIIRWRWAGPVTPEVVEQDLRPLLRRYA